jgi:hypothetical protein
MSWFGPVPRFLELALCLAQRMVLGFELDLVDLQLVHQSRVLRHVAELLSSARCAVCSASSLRVNSSGVSSFRDGMLSDPT